MKCIVYPTDFSNSVEALAKLEQSVLRTEKLDRDRRRRPKKHCATERLVGRRV